MTLRDDQSRASPTGIATAPTHGRRDAAIDTIRGLCIILMTVSHLAEGSLVDRVLHVAPWVDGASGFVLMSGLVLGLVQPGRLRRGGVRAAQVLLVRRAALLYVLHVSTVLLAVAAGYVAPGVSRFPQTEDHGGLLGTVGAVLLLRVNPADIDILSLYVILLLCAVVAVALLARGLGWVALAISAALYLVARAHPLLFTLPMGDGRPSKFDWGAWQLLFVSALVVGWCWKRWDLRARLTSRRAFLVAAGAWFLITLVGVVFASGAVVSPVQPWVSQAYYDKPRLGLARYLLSWAAFVTLYAALSWLLQRWSARWLLPVELLGKRSLAAFVVLTVITILTPTVAGHEVAGSTGVAAAAGALLVMYGYVRLRYRS